MSQAARSDSPIGRTMPPSLAAGAAHTPRAEPLAQSAHSGHYALVRACAYWVVSALALAGCGSSDAGADVSLTTIAVRETTEGVPTAVTLVLTASSPIPPNEQVNGDLEEHCTSLYHVVAQMRLDRYVPYVAKAITGEYGTDDKVGCEIYFGGGSDTQAPYSTADFRLGLTTVPTLDRGPTGDSDEYEVMLTTGVLALVDPTGNEGAGYGDVRVVSVPQRDGSVAFIMGFPGTSLDLTITLADEFARALAASD